MLILILNLNSHRKLISDWQDEGIIWVLTEIATRGLLYKKVFLKVSKISQKKAAASDYLFNEILGWGLHIY